MGAIDFYNLKQQEQHIIFTTTGEQVGLPTYAIEKDWWVMQTLRIIFQMDVGKQLIFKGGTSLSKAWGLISRFSEDIDLVLNREYLGFKSGLISNSQVRKLRTVSFKYITESFSKDLKSSFKRVGIDNLRFEFENLGEGDQDPVSILVFYPNALTYPEYIQPRVKIEIGSRSLKDPFSNRSFKYIVGQKYAHKPYADEEINIPCVNPERTYLEKLYLLHEEFQKPKDKIRVDRLSRHLYDIHQIAKSDYKNEAYDITLIKGIIAHGERFNGMKGVDYTSHFPPNLSPIPPDKYLKLWEADYRKMQEEMIPGDSPSFDEIIGTIKKEVAVYNALKIKVNG